ncbi:MAG: ABC transporter permease [Actinobacteria bacterium]|nr:ABC transporter permease [Actinomycetota bacterium]
MMFAKTTDPNSPAGMKMESLWRRIFGGSSAPIWIATVVLFAVSPLVAPGSLKASALLGMLPFAAVLAVAAVGQMLVIQQRGLDLSVPGMMAFGAALVTGLSQWYGWPLWAAIAGAIIFPGIAGLINGIIVTRFGVMPLVVTLGMNALLLGTVFALSNGTPAGAPQEVADFTKGSVGVVPNALIIAVVVIVVGGFIAQRSIVGRKLTAVGVSERAAAAVGFRVGLYQTMAYALAGAAFGIAAILYAGYVTTPPLFFGDKYLLPTITAVVLGGTALTGGRAAMISTGVAALFLTQLGQLLRAVGWQESFQLIAQSVVLLIVILLRAVIPMISRAIRARRASGQSQAASV